MYYLCSENKGADQLRGYREADLRLCFRICKMLVFSRCGSFHIVGELSSSAMKVISDANKKFQTARKKSAGQMEQETMNILRELYRPFNSLLATLVNDDRFTWLHS